MQKFEQKSFDLKELKGISTKNVEEHLKLYAGYILHTNTVLEKIMELSENSEANMGLLSGLQRRLGFEYNGMRNHEIYFASLSGKPSLLTNESILKLKIEKDWGSFEKWLTFFKSIATTRGVGWAILYYDKKADCLLSAWVDEQHLGQLQNCAPILALDMWEHAYVYDYPTSEKKKYIEAFFENLNWSVIEQNYLEAIK